MKKVPFYNSGASKETAETIENQAGIDRAAVLSAFRKAAPMDIIIPS